MIQAISEGMTLDTFLDWYPDGYGRYELRNGAVIETQPTGTHEQVAGFLAQKLSVEIERLSMPYLIPRQAIIKPVDSDKSSFNLPQQATVTVCEFVEGEYQMQMFRDAHRIICSAFPELTLTAEQIFQAGE